MNSLRLELIGMALNNKSLIPDLISIDESLFEKTTEGIFLAKIKKLYESGEEINEYSLGVELLENSPLEQETIFETLSEAMLTFSDDSLQAYENAKSVLQKQKTASDLTYLLSQAEKQISAGVPVSNVTDTIISDLITLSDKSNFKSRTISLKDASTKLANKLERIEKGEIAKAYTGLTELDETLGGIEAPDVVYIAARPSMGKTSLATQFISYLSKCKPEEDHLIFSLETSDERIAEKFHCQQTKIFQSKFTNGKLEQEDWDRLTRSFNEVSRNNNIFINDRTDISAADVLSECVKHNARRKVGSVAVDYLQLFRPPPGCWSREREVAEQSRIMKILADRLQCPVFILSQLNRSLENRSDKIPVMADLRDSGAIEQDADIIIFIYRDEVYNPNDSKEPGIARLIVAKNKRGRTGFVKVKWNGSITSFQNRY